MTEVLGAAGKAVQAVWTVITRFIANSGRRLYIFYLYGLICWRQQGLRRWYRRLGEKIIVLKDAGDLNPLLHEQVKDYLEILRQRREHKQGLYDRIATVRAAMKLVGQPPPAAPESSSPEKDEAG